MKSNLKKFTFALPLCLSLCAGGALAQEAAAPGQAEQSILAKRASAYGALAHLPKSTEAAVSVHNLIGMFDAVADSNFLQRILELTGQAGDSSDAISDQMREALATYAGDEVVLAYAEGTTVEVGRLMDLYNIYVRLTYGALGRGISSGNFDGDGMEPEMIMEELKRSLGDPDSTLSKALEEIQMPPIIIASKMPEAADGLVAQISEMEGQLPPFVTVATFPAAGTEFKSWAIELKDIFDENAQAEMEEAIGDKAVSDRMAKAIRGKRIEVSFGVAGGYFVVGLGRDHSHLEFVEDPAESLIALDHFKKLDPHLDKPLHGVAFATKEMFEAENSNELFQIMADAFTDGLTAEGSPMMKKLGGKVKDLGGLITRMNKRTASDYIGAVYGGNGLTGHGFGGWMLDSIDGKAKLAFANADIKNAFMVVDNVAKEEYNELGIEMIETIASAVPLGAKLYGEMSGDQGGVDQFMEMNKLFAPKVGKLWNIVKEKVYGGLGQNSAFLVDLNGSLPKIPGVPRVVVNQGKAPRFAIASTVKDRVKLTQAWNEMVPAVNDLLASIPGQQEGAEMQMPDALSSEKGGLVTHYIPLPFLSNDFMPSLSLNNDLFFLSSSKKFSESIAEKVAKSKGGNLRGVYVRVNFTQLAKFAEDWLNLVAENKDAFFKGNEFAAEDFEEGAVMARQALKLSRVLRSFDYNKFTTEAGETRSTWHLRLKDVQ